MTNAWCVLHGLALHDGWCALHRGSCTCDCDHFVRQSGGTCTCSVQASPAAAVLLANMHEPGVKKTA